MCVYVCVYMCVCVCVYVCVCVCVHARSHVHKETKNSLTIFIIIVNLLVLNLEQVMDRSWSVQRQRLCSCISSWLETRIDSLD